MLTIQNLTISSGSQLLVNGLNLELRAGEWLALAGESGSGKTLAAASIGGLLPRGISYRGTLNWKGTDLTNLPPARRRKLLGLEIRYIFQDYQGAFTPFITIGKQLDELLSTHTDLDRHARRALGIEALERVNLPGDRVYRSYPFQLSGGQLQRATIASALMLHPALIIADEPTTALDSLTAQRVLKLIAAAKERMNTSVLWITHDLRHVRKYADRVAVMCRGELVEQGTKDEVLYTPSHPYTKRLIAAIPPLSPDAPERLGQMPLSRRLKEGALK
ncbi:peptide/nickel transport system ATP-binding protein [Paenibacillus forsythiae]|uniref:Peptide/nickel transport system ATP-binding protein n=1 Tax=Paenibacillus forsythiae TaxID=365616 RepID=A0ABU3H636_9BACL|nr:ABC transporter ATP-binding protein [Paenibacillus forsythiae]MDT3426281.1 peptide/nickel transport system ATP-binding protein [Paenibacillus forsythiae]